MGDRMSQVKSWVKNCDVLTVSILLGAYNSCLYVGDRKGYINTKSVLIFWNLCNLTEFC